MTDDIFPSTPQGVLDRFSQIQPKLMFSVEAVVYNGKEHSHMHKLQQVVKGVRPSLGAGMGGACVCRVRRAQVAKRFYMVTFCKTISN